MNVELVNILLNAINNVTKMLLKSEITIKRKFVKDVVFTTNGVVSIIGFIGTSKGQVMFLADEDIVKKIASQMMGGCEVTEVNELVKSAFGEFANMVLGNTSSMYSGEDKYIDITPPTILTGSNMRLSTKLTKPFCLELEVAGIGSLEVDIVCYS